MTPEAKVKKKVKEFLKSIDAYYVMPIGTGFGNSGAPDFIACVMGRFIGIECKANGNRVTALQQDNLDRIEQSGGYAFVVDEINVTDVTQRIKEMFK
jgi:pantoate kinase